MALAAERGLPVVIGDQASRHLARHRGVNLTGATGAALSVGRRPVGA
jgi:hypothetical protein